jgi:anti-sigma regulatory factor (Ser/Thr protein kinase)
MSSAPVAIQQTCVFDGLPQEIRSARHFVSGLVGDCPAAEDVLLLASELATNAIVHTASGHADGTFSVLVKVEGDWIRVEVHDLGSASEPAFRGSPSLQESGAGLFLVQSMADICGYYGSPAGRVVWFEVHAQ